VTATRGGEVLPAASTLARSGPVVGETLPTMSGPTPGQVKNPPPASGPAPGMLSPGPNSCFASDPGDALPPADGCVCEGDGQLLSQANSFRGSGPAPGYRFYGSAEYLLWWIKGFNTP